MSNDDQSTMIVYRIENDDGEGPYNCEKEWPLQYKMRNEHSTNERPNVYVDGCYIGSNGLSGFDSLDRLLWWFDGWVEHLENCGFRTSAYKVDKDYVQMSESGKQLTFEPYRARFVGRT